MPFHYNLQFHLPRRCHSPLTFIHFDQPTNIYGIDLRCEGEDLKGEGMGGVTAEVDLFWYAWIIGGAWCLASWMLGASLTNYPFRQDSTR
jgi:hypothetical protein